MILYSDKLAIIPALNLMLLFYILLCCTFSDLNHKTQTLENPRFGTIATEQKWPESLFQTCKCKKAVSILPHEAKAQLEPFCLYSILFDKRQNSFCHMGQIKIRDFTSVDQEWIGLMVSKNLRIRTGSDSTFSD